MSEQPYPGCTHAFMKDCPYCERDTLRSRLASVEDALREMRPNLKWAIDHMPWPDSPGETRAMEIADACTSALGEALNTMDEALALAQGHEDSPKPLDGHPHSFADARFEIENRRGHEDSQKGGGLFTSRKAREVESETCGPSSTGAEGERSRCS